MIKNFPVVTICGSMKFYEDMLFHAESLTRDGVIVLMPFFVKEDDADAVALDRIHKAKIDMSDSVLIVNTGGYIGDSTRNEIEYASTWGLPVVFTDKGE